MKGEISISDGLRQLPIRPVYLVSVEHDGKKNIISIGMFAYFSGKPTLVGVGIAPSRYSFELVRQSREYVVNVVDEELMEAVRICGEKSGREVEKFEQTKLTPAKGVNVKAPLIKESPLSIECKVVKEVETGDHVWFIGEVMAVHIREGYDWKDGLLFKWIGQEGFYYKIGENTGKY
ncbi:MAG: flavin reductase family protein [Candidatus Bathyarchaeota archaeon]|nr:flavin reductase family protein [Candidatus Bathyarchaeota archaeon]MDH5788674.1 flavin reductase family protein [Candidatus Bathyarchaeota archaeon]